MMYQKRTYRNIVKETELISFKVIVKETDIFVYAEKELKEVTIDIVYKYRAYIESYISRFSEFAVALDPWKNNEPAPLIISDMMNAGIKASVGPMASVAGAMAEYVGKSLLTHSNQVIIENGGDIFLHVKNPITIGIFAGKSPLNLKLGIGLKIINKPFSICTSSGTLGHSLSMGKADAVCVLSESAILADAAATSICNKVKSYKDIKNAIEFGKNIDGVDGIVIIIKEKLGVWGNIELVKL